MADKQVFKNYDEVNFRGNFNLKPANCVVMESIDDQKDHIREIIKCRNDIVYYAEKYYTIINLDVGKMKIKLFEKQKGLIKLMSDENRVVCCSARQMGKTTVAAIVCTHYCCFNEDKKVLLVANKEKSAIEILSRIKLAFELLPKWLKPGIVAGGWNKTKIEFSNGCSIQACATSSSAARGSSVNCLYIDEAAFIPQNIEKEFFASVYPIISSSKNSKVIMTSTPNGLGNLFAETFLGAKTNKNNNEGWKWFEMSWYDHPKRDENWYRTTLASLNNDMTKFRQEFDNCVTGDTLVEVYDKVECVTKKISMKELFETA